MGNPHRACPGGERVWRLATGGIDLAPPPGLPRRSEGLAGRKDRLRRQSRLFAPDLPAEWIAFVPAAFAVAKPLSTGTSPVG